jgi:hypothetical protein
LPYLRPFPLPILYLESYAPYILISYMKASFTSFSTWSRSSSRSIWQATSSNVLILSLWVRLTRMCS